MFGQMSFLSWKLIYTPEVAFLKLTFTVFSNSVSIFKLYHILLQKEGLSVLAEGKNQCQCKQYLLISMHFNLGMYLVSFLDLSHEVCLVAARNCAKTFRGFPNW